MGLEGKLISQIEMKCSGHLLHDHFKSNPHKTSVMSPDKITNFTIHEGQLGKTNSVVTWNYILVLRAAITGNPLRSRHLRQFSGVVFITSLL
uniref:Major latex protein n=1 Tax=Solanum tuberosum TaxID=4113 RepID=M1B313_SOLTU